MLIKFIYKLCNIFRETILLKPMDLVENNNRNQRRRRKKEEKSYIDFQICMFLTSPLELVQGCKKFQNQRKLRS